jgi:hypothetical protein
MVLMLRKRCGLWHFALSDWSVHACLWWLELSPLPDSSLVLAGWHFPGYGSSELGLSSLYLATEPSLLQSLSAGLAPLVAAHAHH